MFTRIKKNRKFRYRYIILLNTTFDKYNFHKYNFHDIRFIFKGRKKYYSIK